MAHAERGSSSAEGGLAGGLAGGRVGVWVRGCVCGGGGGGEVAAAAVVLGMVNG